MSKDLTYAVTYNTRKRPTTRTKEINFGYGYRQIHLDGLNFSEETYEIDFVTVNDVNANVLENLLLNSVNGTANYLKWTPPNETVAKYFTAMNVNKFKQGPNSWKLSCQLRREFPLV